MDAAMLTLAPTAADYARIFDEERQHVYPVIDAVEQACGVAIDRGRLEAAARVLACPLQGAPAQLAARARALCGGAAVSRADGAGRLG